MEITISRKAVFELAEALRRILDIEKTSFLEIESLQLAPTCSDENDVICALTLTPKIVEI